MKLSPNLDPILKKIEPIDPSDSDIIVLFSTRGDAYYTYLYTFFSHILNNSGIASLFLFYNDDLSEYFPTLKINNVEVSNAWLKNSLLSYSHRNDIKPKINWDFDLANKRISPSGKPELNLFSSLINTLRQINRRYTIDFDKPQIEDQIIHFKKTANLSLFTCERLAGYAKESGKRIIIAGYDNSYTPHNIFLEYTQNLCNKIEYLHLGPFYDHYFKDSPEQYADEIIFSNLTARGTWHPTHGHQEKFEKLETKFTGNKSFASRVTDNVKKTYDEKISQGPVPQEKMKKVEGRFGDHNLEIFDSENNLFCLFSQIFFDVSLYERSPIFEDMIDWIDATIDIFKNRDDYLIIKPHPGMAGYSAQEEQPNEKLEDLFREKVDPLSNVILLDPIEYKATDVYSMIDCGLVWRSSVALEMAYLKMPIIVTGKKPYYDGYVDLSVPEDLSTYKSWIDNPQLVKPTNKTQKKVTLFYYFFKEILHYQFPYLSGINFLDKAKMAESLTWNTDNLEKYFEKSDPELEEALLEEVFFTDNKPQEIDS